MPDDALRDLLSEPTVEPDRELSGRTWALIGILTAAVVTGGFWVLRSPEIEPGAGDVSTTTSGIAMATTTTTGLVLDDPPVYASTLGPEPRFDPAPLGTEQWLATIDQFALAERRWFIDLDSREVDAPESAAAFTSPPPSFEVWAGADPDTQWHPFRVPRTATSVEAWEDCMAVRQP
ncbi:MAG: hypothetical protein WEA29_02205 [Acidimicrobiia bacterium]